MDPFEQIVPTVSRIYANVLENKSPSFFDHKNYVPNISINVDDFLILRRIGQGKFGIVFEGMREGTHEKVIIKILKPIRTFKINREIKMLELLRNCSSIVSLISVVFLPNLGQTALIFNTNINNKDFKDFYLTWHDKEIRHYTYEILKALQYCHSHGIMHRDLKPHNLIVNPIERKIILIDFGLAEFYRPEERYSVRVASRHYKSPELLVDYEYYDYSLDLWSLGCIFAAMIFKISPFFNGTNNDNQLVCIVSVLGTHDLMMYLKKYNIYLPTKTMDTLQNKPAMNWECFIKSEFEHLFHNESKQVLEGLLTFDHANRLTTKEVMALDYFATIRKH